MYCTVADVRNALTPGGEASRPGGTAASLEDAQIEDAIREADGVIDLHISLRYSVPALIIVEEREEGGVTVEVTYTVGQQPARYWSRNIAAYLATLTFSRNRNIPEDEPVRLRYNQTMSQLIAVRDGRANLNFPPPGGEDAAVTDGVAVFNQYEGHLFTADDFYIGPAGDQRPRSLAHWPGY